MGYLEIKEFIDFCVEVRCAKCLKLIKMDVDPEASRCDVAEMLEEDGWGTEYRKNEIDSPYPICPDCIYNTIKGEQYDE